MKAQIQQRARELGFDGCRCASALAPSTGAQFERWLAAGKHGEMAYLQANAGKRINPQLVLEGARSIIALAVSYGDEELSSPRLRNSRSATNGYESSELQNAAASGTGVVARYARFSDYHDVMGARLKELTDYLGQIGPENTRSLWYVDTGPILERDLAQRAGLGFIGKHTNLISRKLGNWIFLAEILTTLQLDPDLPETNRCGSCTSCLAACPTQAITAPFELDARRCISYLTIELKGTIPLELRPAIGNRIFGCDDCLAVCPWNRFAQEGKLMKTHGRPDLGAPDLLQLLSLDESGFKQCFAGTPIMRIKLRGLLRNVCVALGNAGDKSALAALSHAAAGEDRLIAEHATWAIQQIQSRAEKGACHSAPLCRGKPAQGPENS